MPRDVIISHTYSPAPCSAQSWRNAAFVTPAIGASTTGVSTLSAPIRRADGQGRGGHRTIVSAGRQAFHRTAVAGSSDSASIETSVRPSAIRNTKHISAVSPGEEALGNARCWARLEGAVDDVRRHDGVGVIVRHERSAEATETGRSLVRDGRRHVVRRRGLAGRVEGEEPEVLDLALRDLADREGDGAGRTVADLQHHRARLARGELGARIGQRDAGGQVESLGAWAPWARAPARRPRTPRASAPPRPRSRLPSSSTEQRHAASVAHRRISSPGDAPPANDVTWSSAMRSWVIVSRSRIVTAWSSRVSKSTVMQNGVPISS